MISETLRNIFHYCDTHKFLYPLLKHKGIRIFKTVTRLFEINGNY